MERGVSSDEEIRNVEHSHGGACPSRYNTVHGGEKESEIHCFHVD